MLRIVAAPMTLLIPGAGPPPTKIATTGRRSPVPMCTPAPLFSVAVRHCRCSIATRGAGRAGCSIQELTGPYTAQGSPSRTAAEQSRPTTSTISFVSCRTCVSLTMTVLLSSRLRRSMIDILVVDDNQQLRDALRTILNKRPGFQVVGEAADGIAASQLAQTLRPAVVLMDVGMARMDGVEATRRIRALLPNTVVIGMSCHTSREVEAALRAVGANAFLPKELVPEKLFDVLAEQLPRRS
ncbi:MAG TPA: hypothetical protein DCQ94_00840 [Nitrospira sp.]|nr:hypothetical protein [Nitrospira sp.]